MPSTSPEETLAQNDPSSPPHDAPTEVGGPYAYYVLAVLFVVYVFNFIDRQILAILLQPIKEDLQVSDTAMGFLTGFAFAVFYAIAGLPLARVADRWVRRSLIALSIATWSLMTAASGLARNFTDLALARVGVGVGEAGCTPPAHSLLSDYFPPEKRATVLAVYACGIYMGVGLGFWLGGWLNDAFGWRVAFMVIGLPGVAMAVVVRFTVREPPRGMSERTVAASRAYSLGETWRFLTRLPSGRRISLAAAFQAFVGYGLAAWIPAFFIRLHGMTPGELGLWLSWITGIGGALGAFSGGWLADRWVRRQPKARTHISLVGALCSTPFIIAALVLDNTTLALLSFFPANVFGTMWLGTGRLDCARLGSAGHAGNGLGGLYLYPDDDRPGCRPSNGRHPQRSDRDAGRDSLLPARRRGQHQSAVRRLFLADRQDPGAGPQRQAAIIGVRASSPQ